MMEWKAVFPAITTPFRSDLTVDYDFLGRHVDWLIKKGARGIVPLGSLGESATLRFEEKVQILETCAGAIAGRVPLIAGIASLSTRGAVDLARAARRAGCAGVMALPPYVYRGDWRETSAHYRAILTATDLPGMLYNNPIAYGTDVTPEGIEELAAIANLQAVKESSGDVRRITAIRERLGGRLAIFVGVDDVIVEGLQAGAVGWIAGLVNALPEESVLLFDLAAAGKLEEASRLYEWFLPLLRLDTVPKFVQLIKLVQAEVGMGSVEVRPPRMELEGSEKSQALSLIRERLARRPATVKRA
jgi:4-hydroxy-tetrahydrodipicolinate synthase